jgi:hypothetical protein
MMKSPAEVLKVVPLSALQDGLDVGLATAVLEVGLLGLELETTVEELVTLWVVKLGLDWTEESVVDCTAELDAIREDEEEVDEVEEGEAVDRAAVVDEVEEVEGAA